MGINLLTEVIAQTQIKMLIRMFTVKKKNVTDSFKKNIQSLKFVFILHMHDSESGIAKSFNIWSTY